MWFGPRFTVANLGPKHQPFAGPSQGLKIWWWWGGEAVVLGGDNVPLLIEIGLTDLLKSRLRLP